MFVDAGGRCLPRLRVFGLDKWTEARRGDGQLFWDRGFFFCG